MYASFLMAACVSVNHRMVSEQLIGTSFKHHVALVTTP